MKGAHENVSGAASGWKGAGLYAFAGLPCTEFSAGTAGPSAGLRQGTDHKNLEGRDIHFGMPRPEVKNARERGLFLFARIRNADGVEAGIDVDHLAGNRAAKRGEQVKRAAGDTFHAGVFLQE